eukprot:TRINITY_DN30298_c0_g1_i2.p1 TRINITY_DN30298_c0_g1~~TRINITY_DN30298_c0_g1_i2.p1  ORF type:complete len:206 (+),score=68.37 TRINITY_DN30298_c0_g1_i2:87-704(+)
MQWEAYRREARRLSSLAEQNLMSLQVVTVEGCDVKEGTEALREETSSILEDLRRLNESMDEATLPQSERLQLESFRQVHYEGTAELKRVLRALSAHHDRAELLGTIHTSLNDYAESHQALDAEAGHIAKAQHSVGMLQDMANESHASLQRTQNLLSRAGTRARELATHVPAVHNLLNQINRRHNREAVILASVVGVCVFLLWLFS